MPRPPDHLAVTSLRAAQAPETLTTFIQRTIIQGGRTFRKLAPFLSRPRVETVVDSAPFKLTPRQLAVGELLVLGMTNKSIAVALVVQVATIKHHVSAMLFKTGMVNRTQLAVWLDRQRVMAAPLIQEQYAAAN